jgi:hypothetical protein
MSGDDKDGGGGLDVKCSVSLIWLLYPIPGNGTPPCEMYKDGSRDIMFIS